MLGILWHSILLHLQKKLPKRNFPTCWIILFFIFPSFKWVFAHRNPKQINNPEIILWWFAEKHSFNLLVLSLFFCLFVGVGRFSKRYNSDHITMSNPKGKKTSSEAYLVLCFYFSFFSRVKREWEQSTASIQAYWHEFNPFAGSNNQHFFGRLHCTSTRRFHMKNHRWWCTFARFWRRAVIQSCTKRKTAREIKREQASMQQHERERYGNGATKHI